MQIIVIRHASTSYNEQELINSIIDEPLSDKGLSQIPELIKSLEGQSFSAVYSSTLQRAEQTARPIAERFGLAYHADKRLIEVNLGSFNGQPWSSTIPAFGLNSSGVLSSCSYDFTPYGGERDHAVHDRVQSFLDDLKAKGQDRPLIVCHGGIMRWFYFLCTGEKTGRIPNVTAYTLELR